MDNEAEEAKRENSVKATKSAMPWITLILNVSYKIQQIYNRWFCLYEMSKGTFNDK